MRLHPLYEFAWNRRSELRSLNSSYCSFEVRYMDCNLALIAHSCKWLVRGNLNTAKNAYADVFRLHVLCKRERFCKRALCIDCTNELFLIDSFTLSRLGRFN